MPVARLQGLGVVVVEWRVVERGIYVETSQTGVTANTQ